MTAERASEGGVPAVSRPRRVLVIGGGLIGGHVAVELESRGHAVTVYSRSVNPWLATRLAAGLRVSIVRSQVPLAAGQPPSADLEELVADSDIVAMLAGTSTPAFSDQDAVGSVVGSLVPVLTVLDTMRRTQTRRIVLASSGGTVYGRVTTIPTPEDHATDPISLHGFNALASERYASFYARVHGLQPVVLRFSNVYGPGQRARGGQGVIAAWSEALAARRPITLIGEGDVRRDFVHAGDAAGAVTAAVERELEGTFNIGGGGSVSLAGLLAELAAVAGVEPRVERLPARAIDVPVTELDCSRYRDAAGWRAQMALSAGLAETWGWFAAARPPTAG